MALFRQGLPRKATLGAFVGFVYSVIVLIRGDFGAALGWFLLSISLLFAKPIAYYGFLTWAILWLAWRALLTFRGEAGPVLFAVLDVSAPLLAIALVSSAGYLEFVRGHPDE